MAQIIALKDRSRDSGLLRGVVFSLVASASTGGAAAGINSDDKGGGASAPSPAAVKGVTEFDEAFNSIAKVVSVFIKLSPEERIRFKEEIKTNIERLESADPKEHDLGKAGIIKIKDELKEKLPESHREYADTFFENKLDDFSDALTGARVGNGLFDLASTPEANVPHLTEEEAIRRVKQIPSPTWNHEQATRIAKRQLTKRIQDAAAVQSQDEWSSVKLPSATVDRSLVKLKETVAKITTVLDRADSDLDGKISNKEYIEALDKAISTAKIR